LDPKSSKSLPIWHKVMLAN